MLTAQATTPGSAAIQQRVNAFLTVPSNFRAKAAQAGNPKGFSVFDKKQADQASDVAADLMRVANSTHDLNKVMDEAESLARTMDPEVVRQGLMIFLTHHPLAQSAHLVIPSLGARAGAVVTAKVRPSASAGPISSGVGGITSALRNTQVSPPAPAPAPASAPAPAPAPALQAAVASAPQAAARSGAQIPLNNRPNLTPEDVLDYWRDDVNLNEHHEHWHVVYPSSGVPNPRNPNGRSAKDRQGEIFIYMHQQMIARYNAERLASSLPPVKALTNFLTDALEGDIPEDDLRINGKGFTPRPNNLRMTDLGVSGQKGYLPVSQLWTWKSNLEKAIDAGRFQNGTVITPHLLGSTLEASVDGVDSNTYGNLHNMGHVIIAYISSPRNYQDPNVAPGLMYETRTAVRDPVFWRWHSMIDDLFFRWQERQAPIDFGDAPKSISIRKSINAGVHASQDIIFAFTDVLQQAGVNAANADAVQQWGQSKFGGANFDQADIAKLAKEATSELQTTMLQRAYTYVDDDGKTEMLDYMLPRDFYYFFRIQNAADKSVDVTLRVFLVPVAQANNRRAYIEMDKFKVTVPAKSKYVVSRRCDQSSVIRKPAQKTPQELNNGVTGRQDRTGDAYCDCGWPYNLLLPRGTKQGQAYRLVVLATDWNIDMVPQKEVCGSMSFCGAKEKYPDTRPMGYPFHARWKTPSIEESIKATSTFASRDIVIRWVDRF
ncbi:uncharacterized protein BJ171DRAFT_495429 [Polychytrium aggregatum]|uniref:uncharacterized protein n=1 Tax=Polychytrium aggregatum TaxID=110093 RepID=UPI0022FEA0D2|nr:uncharacterized protein BJ171DRAFT_495429 [Polychytrium aggregatum]KAI9207006.1 hypothetical protein BJ171DRAFT_495429 [Polychytrium aggregatum]